MSRTTAHADTTSVTSPPPRRFGPPARHRAYPWLAAVVAVVALVRCWTIVTVYNHTTDELAHVAGAVGLYESGRNVYMVEHPTLQRLVVGAALKAKGVEYPRARDLTAVQARPDANVAGADILFDGPVGYWQVLATARRANLVFLAVLLLYTFLLGRYLASPLAGLLAVAFLSVDANILAHAALVTTDIPAAAGFLAATYHALRFVARPTWPTATLAAVALGLAMSCKFTCVLLAPAILILIAIRALRHAAPRWHGRPAREESPRASSPSKGGTGILPVARGASRSSILRRALAHAPKLRHLLAIPLFAFLTLWATYLFTVGRLEDQHLFDEEKTWNRIPQWAKRAPIPMPAMPLGVMFMAAIGKTGFPCYFNGQLDFKGHLAYFPEALAIKSPTALVVAVGLALVACAVARRRRLLLAACLLLPPSFLLLTAMTGKLQIGIRHVLPVIPFVYLFTVFYLHRRRWVLALIPLILLAGVETARAHPDYLPFFNTLVGGPRNGPNYLADSNLDWGQDVARLADYLKATGRTDYTVKVSGVRVARLFEFLGLDPASRERDIDALRNNPHGLFAIGVNARLGLEDFKKEKDGTIVRGPDYTWLKSHPIVARIGYSIDVYDLDRRTHVPTSTPASTRADR
jgi:hypothetical protein